MKTNLKNLKPEIITTGDLIFEYFKKDMFAWTTNLFYTVFENQIAYPNPASSSGSAIARR